MNKNVSKIYIASDHRGVGLKLYLIEMLAADGYQVKILKSCSADGLTAAPL